MGIGIIDTVGIGNLLLKRENSLFWGGCASTNRREDGI